MKSSKTFAFHGDPVQTIEQMKEPRECGTCHIINLYRPQFGRAACPTCAAKAWADTPILLLYLLREFRTLSSSQKTNQVCYNDLARLVYDDILKRLEHIEREIDRQKNPD